MTQEVNVLAKLISIHALTWRATWRRARSRLITRHFYPRPHVEGDVLKMKAQSFEVISIHALTWRATGLAVFFIHRQHISIHALTWRATTHYYVDMVFYNNFYPRPHVEGDSKHAEVQACISAAYLKCSTRKAAASSRRAGLGGRVVLFHQLSRLVLGRARCEPRGEGMCDRGSHRRSAILKVHSSRMSSWLH